MSAIGKAELGACTFCASSFPNDKCGANGLPLTPCSIKILGRFQKLLLIEHPRLCKYVDLVRSKHERVIVVAEHHTNNLLDEVKTDRFNKHEELVILGYEILQGLEHLNKNRIVHRNLSPQNIEIDIQGHVKLAKYGLYYMTESGVDVSFPIGNLKYMAPEVLSQGSVQLGDHGHTLDQPSSGPKADVWSLGVILLETYLNTTLWTTLTLQQIIYKILGFLRTNAHPLDLIVSEHNGVSKIKELPEEVNELLRRCLMVSPLKRPTPKELLDDPMFQSLREKEGPYRNGIDMFSVDLRCHRLELPAVQDEVKTLDEVPDHLGERSIHEVYYLWRLTGGDLETTLKKAGLIKGRPPITAVPNFVVEDGEVFGKERDRGVLLDDTVVVLSQEQLRQRLSKIDEAAYYPLLENEKHSKSFVYMPTSPSSGDLYDAASLELVIREKDIEYQFHRMILFDRLLRGYPYKQAEIWKEARTDIPPFFRSQVWAALLEVKGDVFGHYDAIDKETPTTTDRQIEVDIPRCHQYNELLSSPSGHTKFKRVLKAWVVSHPEYVYWQGLDSLCAPFLFLNFNNEAVALSCLSAFIPKYLHNFFLKDNSQVIQEYLAVFSHMIAFHEPELSNHLDSIGFIPDLYAIPWFLTMYTHVFPLHKLFHLWDTLLLGNSSFPLCIGVAILQQFKDQLLKYGFNECILHFSDMPEIDIEKCVRDSIRVFCSTPKSATFRQHAKPTPKTAEGKNGRPNGSYYSQDYQSTAPTDLSMEAIPLELLRSEKCPRISAEDMIDLCELRGPSPTRSPTKRSRTAKPLIVVIDVRNHEEFNRGSIPGSINIPFTTAFNPEGDLVNTPSVQTLNSMRHRVKVVVGSRGKNAALFANMMVQLGYTKVCILHKGLDVLRPTGLLVVPPPEL